MDEKIKQLNDLILNSPDFDKLQRLVGNFNLFRVLRLEHYEIRHSNMLGWLLDPNESHGLGDVFLKRWLMRVLHEASIAPRLQPIQVMSWDIRSVEVRREWKNIDLVIVLLLNDGDNCVVCIENKVGSKQGENQLNRYQRTITREFPDTKHHLFIFLTRDGEQPTEDASDFIMADYDQVHKSLKESTDIKSPVLGAEPKILIENYIRLLEEQFMTDSTIAQLARKIYDQHREALDLIFEQRPDRVRTISEALQQTLKAQQSNLRIRYLGGDKFYIRFLPSDWDLPTNKSRGAWSGEAATVITQLSINEKRILCSIVTGNAPEPWISSLWDLSSSAPFKRRSKTMPTKYCTVHEFFTISLDGYDDTEEMNTKLVENVLLDLRSKLNSAAESGGIIPLLRGKIMELPIPDQKETSIGISKLQ